ncbi:methyltransferase domain-containing protein [Rhizobium lentis]|uniref:class I SAM-dependent methyltransferase n=1 Tax=Rhizobium lentis TaxID=1138194 RepID=UPI001C829395|nr:methyltransferase domain-containing protein [Rhizobium lentis]MBX5056664.1 methyltransferase domain-containing protein [Rhizobium lentis]MBX5074642.1 methyltransferase domain-containing protein [Rhizobium lentis]MBX5111670.1 methyltransferase domain-containing protein [Rhizobium lentis]MBX5117990.1 methyltransferase domain-containing protein [Rhizobium lentis]
MHEIQNVSGLVGLHIPTFSRWLRMLKGAGTISTLRCLEYERLKFLGLEGLVLDFGGGSRTNYSQQVKEWTKCGAPFVYESANIDPNTEPTYLIEPNGLLPCPDQHYDAVVSLNTFEHIYHGKETLSKLQRVLKKDGKLHFIVPFIFRVHGHPSDYIRGTPAYWQTLLDECGFTLISTTALLWGPYSTACSVTGLPGPFKRTRIRIALTIDYLLARWKFKKGGEPKFKQDHPAVRCALGYLISANRE